MVNKHVSHHQRSFLTRHCIAYAWFSYPRCCLHRESLPAGEVQRYEAQYRFIQQICALYEEEPNDFGKLFTLIQEVKLTNPCSALEHPQSCLLCLVPWVCTSGWCGLVGSLSGCTVGIQKGSTVSCWS